MNGRLSFIIPDTYLFLNMHSRLRELIFTNTKIDEILIFSSKFFPGVNFGYSNLSIITLERCDKKSALDNTFRVIQGFNSSSEFATLLGDIKEYPDNLQIFKFKQSDILDNEQCRVILAESKTSTLLSCSAQKLGNVADIVTGFYTGDNLRFIRAASKDVKGAKNYDIVNPVTIARCTSLYGIPDVEEGYVPYIKSAAKRRYDYRKGKERIEAILDNELIVIEQNELPTDDAFTFSNGYYSWVTGIFVDIRDSSELFADEDKEKVSKVIRSFTSEVIEILRKDENLREIGIRGDCVYAIYTTPSKDDIYELADKTFYINTYMKMLNKLLSNRSLPEINVGIGMSTAQELVVKAGRKDVGINSKVWIGKAVTRASNFSSLGNKKGNPALVYSNCSYINFIDKLKEVSGGKAKDWFTYHSDEGDGAYYTANIVKSDFDKWISNGMKD